MGNNQEIAESYLDIISLDSGDRQASEHDDAAQLMTMHSAKGLEFKLVLLTGLEESLFPHGRSMESVSQLEEERRLCYVGMTRAMKKLHIVHSEMRNLHGSENFNSVSRFLKEIPEELSLEVRTGGSIPRMKQKERSYIPGDVPNTEFKICLLYTSDAADE